MNAHAEVSSQDAREPPLRGVRVLDLGRYIAAPFCAQLLSNEGAEVIRIEPPGGGSDRDVMPVGLEDRGGLYLQVNSNKKSVTLDYMKPSGRKTLERLIASSDVVVVNLPHKALAKLRLDYDSLIKIKPDIILTTISAFSYDGPDADRIGFDGTGQALSGAMYLTGSGDRPTRAAVSYVDYATAISAAFATMSALIDRLRSGRGQHVQCSLFGAALTMMNPMLMEEATGFRSRRPLGNRSPIAGPSDLFRTRDGWVMVQVIGDAMFRRWATTIGRDELIGDTRFRADSDRGVNGDALSAIMSEWCAQKTVAECLAELDRHRVPACPCLQPKETLALEGLADYVEPIAFDDEKLTVPLVVRAIRTEASRKVKRRAAPRLGADTREVLNRLGVSADECDQLAAQGVI